MAEQNSSSEDQKRFRITGKLNLIFIILISLSTVPIAIGFIGIFDQFTQPVIVHTTISSEYDALYTINLEKKTIYYIEIALSDIDTAGDFSADLSLFKGTEEVYQHNIQQTIRSRQRGIIKRFSPFISALEGSYIINCTINYDTDITYPFYIKMQRASEISQITGFSGEEILEVGMSMFLAVVVLLTIVALIARFIIALKARKLVDETESSTNKFVWKSKDENENS